MHSPTSSHAQSGGDVSRIEPVGASPHPQSMCVDHFHCAISVHESSYFMGLLTVCRRVGVEKFHVVFSMCVWLSRVSHCRTEGCSLRFACSPLSFFALGICAAIPAKDGLGSMRASIHHYHHEALNYQSNMRLFPAEL